MSFIERLRGAKREAVRILEVTVEAIQREKRERHEMWRLLGGEVKSLRVAAEDIAYYQEREHAKFLAQSSVTCMTCYTKHRAEESRTTVYVYPISLAKCPGCGEDNVYFKSDPRRHK